jgi:hypothetical protein
MRARGSGLIINISSIAGRMAVFSHSAYGPSKFALEAASEVAAQELAPFGVRVALVEPGIIATDMAVVNLPQSRADSAYPHGRRMVAMNADAKNGTPPAVVANAVLDIVSGRNTSFRTLCGADAQMFIDMRDGMTDEAWIAMSDTLDDGVFFGGGTAVHQFVRIGKLAITQGHSSLSKDLPPFLMASELNSVVGLNVVGLKRAGFSPDQRSEVKEAFSWVYRRGYNLAQALELARSRHWGVEADCFWSFVQKTGKRGICGWRGRRARRTESEGAEPSNAAPHQSA